MKYLITIFLCLIPLVSFFWDNGRLWSVHHALYLPQAWSWLLWILALAVVWQKQLNAWVYSIITKSPSPVVLWLIGILAIAFLPTETTAYGDGRTIIARLQKDGALTSVLAHFGQAFNLLEIGLHTGEQFATHLARALMVAFQLSVEEAFRVMGIFWGALALGFWLWWLKKCKPQWVLAGFLLFIASWAMQQFHGHVEIYAAPTALCLITSVLGYLSFNRAGKEKIGWLIGTWLVALLAVRSHFSMFLLLWIPALATLQYLLPEKGVTQYAKKPKWQLLVMFPIGLVLLLVLYFMVFESAQAPYYQASAETAGNNTLLPISLGNPPYHQYGLLHFNHLWDYAMLTLGWGWPLLLVLIHRRKVVLQKPEVGLYLLPSLGFALLWFFFNPILGMPRDWDLMTIHAPLVMLLALVVLPEKTELAHHRWITAVVFIGGLFGIVRMTVENQPSFLAKRLVHTGVYMHSTYHAGAVVPITHGIEMLDNLDVKWLETSLNALREQAFEDGDPQVAHVFTKMGKRYMLDFNEPAVAVPFFEEALRIEQSYRPAVDHLALACQNAGMYKKGLFYAEQMIGGNLTEKAQMDYLKIAINCAIKLKEYEKARQYAGKMLDIAPNNKTAQALLEQLSR